jgi:hypothetical protein
MVLGGTLIVVGVLLMAAAGHALYRRGFDDGYAAGSTRGSSSAGAGSTGNYFWCHECGARVAVDEDGCCRTCGRDTEVVGPYPPPAPTCGERGHPLMCHCYPDLKGR